MQILYSTNTLKFGHLLYFVLTQIREEPTYSEEEVKNLLAQECLGKVKLLFTEDKELLKKGFPYVELTEPVRKSFVKGKNAYVLKGFVKTLPKEYEKPMGGAEIWYARVYLSLHDN